MVRFAFFAFFAFFAAFVCFVVNRSALSVTPWRSSPDFKGAIGVTETSVEGVDITVPVFSFAITRYIPAASMTPTYIGNLYALTGRTNNASWSLNVDGVQLTFAAGEALFLGASGSKRPSDDWEINFRFSASPNAANLTIGDITGVNKKGWEYLWVRYATAGETWWLRDDTKGWIAEGTLIEHTGTATAGSATSLTDAAKAADGFWTTAGRGRFAEHVLEITTGAHAGTRVPIDSSSGTTLYFRNLGFSTAGLGYRIREPAYELNRWQQRVLRLTKPDGTVLPDIAITHSDDNTLYFAPQAEAIGAGWKYQIVEASTGTVWLRQSGQWVVPPPQAYGSNQYAVRPTVVRRYGRYMKGDYLPTGLFDEIRQAINKLKHIAKPFSWSAFVEPWIDTPLVLGMVDTGGTDALTDYDVVFTADLVGKDVQIRSWATGAMSRFTITGVDGYTLYFDGQGYTTNWGDDYWVLDPDARDVVPNDRIVADSIGGGNVNDWLDQYGRVAGDWAEPRYPGQRPRLADGKAPRCITFGSDYQGYNDPGVYYYSAMLAGTHAYGKADIPYRNWDGAIFSVQTDFYEFTDYGQPRSLPPHEAEFIDNGEVGQWGQWVKFDTKASRTDGNPTMSRKFGEVNTCPAAGQAPPPAPEPDGSTIYDTANGYLVTDAKVVMRFETSGLLTFL